MPLVENGRFERGDAVAELVVEEYLSGLKGHWVDTLVLGCTHYPLLRAVIGAYMGPDVALVDAGGACAGQVAGLLRTSDALNGRQAGGRRRYFVTDSVDGFARLASLFLGEDVVEQVQQVDITSF